MASHTAGHVTIEGHTPSRQRQQQAGMLDHLAGIDFNRTLVSAPLPSPSKSGLQRAAWRAVSQLYCTMSG